MAESKDTTAEDARTAAAMEAEVGAEHIADVYAKGLLGTTEKTGQTAAVVAEFDALMTEVLDRFPEVRGRSGLGLDLAGREVRVDRPRSRRPRFPLAGQFPEGSWRGTADWIACGRFTARRARSTTNCGTGFPCG